MKLRSRRHIFSRLLRQQLGDSIIETAVVLPAFVLLLFGIFQFSLGLTKYLGAVYAIRSAARWASVRSNNSLAPSSTTDVQNFMKASPFFPTATGTSITVGYVTGTGGSGSNIPGDFIFIYLSYPQSVVMPFYSNTFTINSLGIRYIVR